MVLLFASFPAWDDTWPYVAVFLAALAIDLIPFLAPPAWVVLVVLLVRYDLDPWAVIVLGVAGVTVGRYLLGLYLPWAGRRVLPRRKAEDLEAVGTALRRAPASVFGFVFLYSLTPLSTAVLFTAAGLARVRPRRVLPPFFLGKLVSYSVLVLASRHLVTDPHTVLRGAFTGRSVGWAVGGVVVILAFIAVDWRELLLRRRVRMSVRVWKPRRSGLGHLPAGESTASRPTRQATHPCQPQPGGRGLVHSPSKQPAALARCARPGAGQNRPRSR